MTTRRSTTLVAGIAVAVLLLAGCGDDGDGGDEEGGGRPTTEEMLAVLPDLDLDDQGRRCVAEAFVDSEISDEGLQAIVDAGGLDRAQGVSATDQEAVQTALGEGIRCSVADELPSATATTTAGGSSTEPGATEPGATEPGSSEPTTTAAG